jgi:hypothetical protein
MLADGRRWRRIKKPIRKITAGLPTEIAQLRISGLTYGEIAKRLGRERHLDGRHESAVESRSAKM